VRDAGGQPLRAAAQVNPGAAIDIEFHDGHVGAMANTEGTAGPPSVGTKSKPRRGGGQGQGSLF
jgi:exodeoxyribonuclease VII large subunit